MRQVQFTLNGQPVDLEVEDGLDALSVLRDHLGVVSAKDGCSGHGECGACTVLWNGKPTLCCTRDVSRLQGAELVTLEGLDDHRRQVLARAFVKEAGLQCGFCIPGIALRTAALLDKTPDPDDARIRAALQPHLCRCTGYTKVFRSVKEAARHWRADTLPELPPTTRVGDRAARYQGLAIVLGEKPYVADLNAPGVLHAALRLSDHPRARVLSIDVAAAMAMPGVHAVLTAEDLPAARTTGPIRSDTPVFVAEGGLTHCVGSVLAAVAADTRQLAQQAAAAIEVDYQVLEPITDIRSALADGAPEVHPGQPNHAATTTVRRGDVDAALAASTHVLEETFHTQRVEHAYLEVECALAQLEGDGIRVFTQGQGVHEDRHEIAAVLGWPEERVEVTLVSNGGGFGGKEDVTVQHYAALLAVHTGRSVMAALSREQSIRLHPKRHPMEMRYTVGFDADGRLTAVRARVWGDTGGYFSVGDKVLERAGGHACGPYHVPAVDIEACTVYTNNLTAGAFRGFGVVQTAFGIEGMLDRMAARLGIDGYDIRERNILEVGQPFATGQLMDEGLGIRHTLEAVREVYKANPGAGIACGIKNTGIGNGVPDIGRALVLVDGPDHVTVYTGFTEMGQGLLTICRQILCHETGLDPEQVAVVVSTDHPVECGMTTASRGTLLAGEATRRAAVGLAEALQGTTLAELEGRGFPGEFICDFTVAPEAEVDNPVTHVTFGYATQVVLLDDQGRVDRVVAAHDVGRVMNRATCEGQIEGQVHMGLGMALTEDLPCDGGQPVHTRLNDLRIIRARDVCDVEVILLEVPDPHSEYGMKGVGEIGLVPTPGAVASALYGFDGIFRNRLPMRGSAAARALLPRKLHEPDHA